MVCPLSVATRLPSGLALHSGEAGARSWSAWDRSRWWFAVVYIQGKTGEAYMTEIATRSLYITSGAYDAGRRLILSRWLFTRLPS